MNSSKFETAPIPPTVDQVQRQPVVTLLRRIKLPQGGCVDDGDLLPMDREAAEFLRISPRTLQRLRQSGAGPPVVQISRRRLIYRLADLQQWAADQSTGRTRVTNPGDQTPALAEIADPTKRASGASEDRVSEVCGRCQSFSDGHCHARGFAVGAEEPGCPLFVSTA